LYMMVIYAKNVLQMSFPRLQDRVAAWGLKNSNLTFVRREIRTLVLQYIQKGDALVEYS
jgi:hypothetical protein